MRQIPPGRFCFISRHRKKTRQFGQVKLSRFPFIRLEDALGLEAMLEGRGMDGVAERRLRRDLALAD